MGHVEVGYRWERVAMDLLDMSVTTARENRYVMVDCFSRWTEACPLPDKTEEVPAFALRMRELRGEQPKVQLMDNPWCHVEDCVAKCNCLDTDRTGAYVHCLIPRTGKSDSTPLNDAEVSVEIENGFTFNNDCGYLGVGRAGSIPFVSEKPGAYGRLLLAVYVRWRTGLLISSD